MTVPALAAAKRLGEVSDWSLTNLYIQKLLYLAHMFYMGQKDGEPLLTGHFEAWAFGPVHPKVYHTAKVCESRPVEPKVFHSVESLEKDRSETEYLDKAVEELPLQQLVAITHWEQGAWRKNYVSHLHSVIISNLDILEEYKAREDAAKSAKS